MIITLASSKGGVGKSTIAVSLTGALAARDSKVHIIDLDENQTVLRWFNDANVDLPNITVTTAAEEELATHIQELGEGEGTPDVIIIDVAGIYAKGLLYALFLSDLVLIPAQLSEPDVHEARKVIQELANMRVASKREIPHRVVLNLVEHLNSHVQRHVFGEIERLGLPRAATVLHKRMAYRETFLTGAPPHFADTSREGVQKAIKELDAFVDEVLAFDIAEQAA